MPRVCYNVSVERQSAGHARAGHVPPKPSSDAGLSRLAFSGDWRTARLVSTHSLLLSASVQELSDYSLRSSTFSSPLLDATFFLPPSSPRPSHRLAPPQITDHPVTTCSYILSQRATSQKSDPSVRDRVSCSQTRASLDLADLLWQAAP